MTALATRYNALATVTDKLAARFDLGHNGAELIETLKATAFKGQVTDAQMTALMVVANQYGLNPWTKEIYAFPDRQNGIVPVVGVDGWARIINDHPQFDGMEFDQDGESCTCAIYRKDRSRPTRVTEFLAECKRDTAPWKSHPRRMMRHKAMIQAARLAFGYGGIYDQDEAERIVERNMGPAAVVDITPSASRTADVKAKLAQRGNRQVILDSSPPAPEPGPDLATVLRMIEEAFTRDELKASVDAAKLLPTADQKIAREAYKARVAEIKAQQEAEAAAMAEPTPETQTVAEWQAEFMGGEAHG